MADKKLMSDKELFKILCPDGCWHGSKWDNYAWYEDECKCCGLIQHRQHLVNPDFSTWDGFGVMIEEGQKRDWWFKFWAWMYRKFQRAPLAFPYIKSFYHYILYHNHPARFRDVLKEFHMDRAWELPRL